MQSISKLAIVTAVIVSCMTLNNVSAQIDGGGGGKVDPVLFFGVNNSGEIQNGVGGPDNLVMFEVTPLELTDEGEIPTLDDVPQIQFSIVGNITTGIDTNGDGVDDSIGTFSGLEWSSGTPGVGTLIGCVLDDEVGDGEFYQIDPDTALASLIGTPPVHFSDLAFNPVDGLMYGLVNDITQDGDNLSFGPNTIWVDTDGDIIPDTPVGDRITIDPFCIGAPLSTLASGLTFNVVGIVAVYDNIEEQLHLGTLNSDAVGVPPCAPLFEDAVTNLDNNETEIGNGLTSMGFDTFFFATDTTFQTIPSTVISFYILPAPDADPLPQGIPAGIFPPAFFQGSFQPSVTIGDFVLATAETSDLPATFPSNIIVNQGTPGKNAILEAVVVSDDFSYCIAPEPATPKTAPVDVTFVYTVPNPTNLTVLELEIESQSNTVNLVHDVSVLDIDTGEFVLIGSEAVAFSADGTVTVDLSANIAQFVNQTNGTMTCRIATRPGGPTLFFPWQLKYDSVLVLSE